ncbi:GtrA family protein [Lusitaniella coriacea LEGE 07157]|uniref:GtrA family protein n=1 Tax=Lusitaniella coriacea LEGE 07157 TaxID=945747 RepID=A0A8J7DV20_9CYAN|nr:GtrA family protein [Lusitaniella coriacea LEGE 07157]
MSNDSSKKKRKFGQLKKLLKFFNVGLFCAGLNFSLLYCLTTLLGFHYLASTTLSFVFINFIGFYLNKNYTFKTHKNRFLRELCKYYSVMLSSFFLNLALMYVFVDIFGVWYLHGSLTVTVIFMIYNFLLHQYWSFK